MAQQLNIQQDNQPNGWIVIVMIILTMIISMCLSSCTTTKYVTVPEVHTKYITRVDSVRDSIYHDVFHNVYVKGDTVYDTKIETQFRDRWHNRIDTLIQNDSIPIPYPVERKLNKWEQVKQDWFGELVAVAILSLLVNIIVFILYIRGRFFHKS